MKQTDVKGASLRAMKRVALGFLILAAALFVFADVMAHQAPHPAWGFVRAAAEAGVVGGLADWFAVTALFRHPLGIPIPHTALIPRRKDELADGLGDFVQEHFLTRDAVTKRIAAAQIPQRLSRWAATPEGARSIDERICPIVQRGVEKLREDSVKPVLAQLVRNRVEEAEVAAVIGRVLDEVLAENSHQPVVESVLHGMHTWVVENRSVVVEAVVARAPEWTPDWVDDMVAVRLHKEMCRFMADVVATPDHRFRQEIDTMLQKFATSLRTDPELQAKVERAKNNLMDRPEVTEMVADIVSAGRRIVIEMLGDPESLLRQQLRAFIQEAGRAVRDDADLAASVESYVADSASLIATRHSGEITALITETMKTWDGHEAAMRIEQQAGRDLQFIRINGTVVGALVGLVLYSVSQLWH